MHLTVMYMMVLIYHQYLMISMKKFKKVLEYYEKR